MCCTENSDKGAKESNMNNSKYTAKSRPQRGRTFFVLTDTKPHSIKIPRHVTRRGTFKFKQTRFKTYF
jgi:hypothetical protein